MIKKKDFMKYFMYIKLFKTLLTINYYITNRY